MEIPGYQTIRELGRGGMATVYLAVQQSLGREVALKVMTPSLAADGDFRERFYQEARVIAQLMHPRIVTVYDFGSREGLHFLSMEYLSGGTLKERIKAGLEPRKSASIVAAIAQALAYAHRSRVVHRDIKPPNILFRADGTPVLSDFGIARLVDADTHLTQTGMAIGSPRYMSPEQVLQRSVDGRTDIYSLGIVLYEMLTGDIPWADTNGYVSLAMQHCNTPVPALPPELGAFQPVLEKCLAKEPDERYQDADDLASDLSALATESVNQSWMPTVRVASLRDRLATIDGWSPAPTTGQMKREATVRPGISKLPLSSLGAIALLAVTIATVGWYFAASDFVAEQKDSFLDDLNLPLETADRPIAIKYEALAIEHLRNQQLDLSMALIQAGLKAVPDDNRLLALASLLEKHQAAQGHLELAQSHLERGMLEAGAVEISKGLEAVPDHENLQHLEGQLLQQQRARKAEQLLQEAQEDIAAGDLDAGLARISAGLRQVSGHEGLLSLRREVVEQAARRRRVDAVLVQVHELERRERWQQALQAVREGMAIDADDHRLEAEEERLETALQRYLTEEVRRILEDGRQPHMGDFAVSLGLIEDGLRLLPKHARLLELRREILQAMEDERKAEALLAEARQRFAQGDLETSLTLIDEGLSLNSDDEGLLQLNRLVETDIRERAARQAQELYNQAVALEAEGKLNESLSVANRGLALSSQDDALQALSDRLQQSIEQMAQRTEKANNLFSQARQRLKANAPQEAAELARQVLALVPAHSGASELQQRANEMVAFEEARVRGELVASVRQLHSDGRLEEARSLSVQGLKEFPDDADLLALNEQINSDIEARDRRQAKIEQRHADEAKSAELRTLAQDRLGAGALDEALGFAAHALRLTPDNSDGLALRDRIDEQSEHYRTVENHVADAERLLAEGNLALSRAQIDAARKALANAPLATTLREQLVPKIEQHEQKLDTFDEQMAAAPDDPKLTAPAVDLRTEIAQQQATKGKDDTEAQTQARLENLLAQCREHQRAKRLTTGKGGTAFHCYQDVLEREPSNERARKGLQEIAGQYAAWATNALSSYELSSARTYIERLATVDPSHGELDHLRTRLAELSTSAPPMQKRRRTITTTPKNLKPKAPIREKAKPSRSKPPIATPKVPAYTAPKQSPPPTHKSPPTEEKPKRPIVGGF